MSGSKTSNKQQLDMQGAAFEYVAGTLSASEHREFEHNLSDDSQLRDAVNFWEEQLLPLHAHTEALPHSDNLWQRIAANIESPSSVADSSTKSNLVEPVKNLRSFWVSLWQWGAPTFAALALAVVLIGYYPKSDDQVAIAPGQAIPDYVAVLTDNAGNAMLTAVTTQEGSNNMYLKWGEQIELTAGSNVQLWAVSKRDGVTRPLAVFANTETASLVLDEATWRLVTDSAFLLLTEEEEGGSPLDEPSDALLAKGVCVRFSREGTI